MTTTQECLIATKIAKGIKRLLKESGVPNAVSISVEVHSVGTHFELSFNFSEKSTDTERRGQCRALRNGFIHEMVSPMVLKYVNLLGWKKIRIKKFGDTAECPMKYVWQIEKR